MLIYGKVIGRVIDRDRKFRKIQMEVQKQRKYDCSIIRESERAISSTFMLINLLQGNIECNMY